MLKKSNVTCVTILLSDIMRDKHSCNWRRNQYIQIINSRVHRTLAVRTTELKETISKQCVSTCSTR